MPLRDFEWTVDSSGYDLTELRGFLGRPMSVIRPRGGKSRLLRPLVKQRELHHDFAACRDARDALRFVQRWGLLRAGAAQDVEGFLNDAFQMRVLLQTIASILTSPLADAGLAPLVEQLNIRFRYTVTDVTNLPVEGNLVPIDLYNALQYSATLGVVSARPCKCCGTPILIGPGHRKRGTEFCSHAHLVAWRRRQRRVASPAPGTTLPLADRVRA
jgi:hypothetical protein